MYFLEVKAYTFESCLYSKLGNDTVFAQIDEKSFGRATCSQFFCQGLFCPLFAGVAEKYEFFQTNFLHTLLPNVCVNFDNDFLPVH